MVYLFFMSLGILSYFKFYFIFTLIPVAFISFFNKNFLYLVLVFLFGLTLIFIKTTLIKNFFIKNPGVQIEVISSSKNTSKFKENLFKIKGLILSTKKNNFNNVYEVLTPEDKLVIMYSKYFYNIGDQVDVCGKKRDIFNGFQEIYFFFKGIVFVCSEVDNECRSKSSDSFKDNEFALKKPISLHGINSNMTENNVVYKEKSSCKIESSREKKIEESFSHNCYDRGSASKNQSSFIKKVKFFIYSIRFKIHNKFIEHFGRENGPVLSLITTGLRDNVKDVYSLFSEAGISHILAISGLHISIVFFMLFLFLRRFLILFNIVESTRRSSFISLFIAFLYVAFSGFTISGIRAFIMSLIYTIGLLNNKKTSQSLEVAGIIILFFWPESVVNPGFVLSFISVLSLLVTQRKLSFMYQLIYTSLVTFVLTMPYTVYFFKEISIYGVVNNIIILPVVIFIIMPIAILNIFTWTLGFNFSFHTILKKSLKLILYISEKLNGKLYNIEFDGFFILILTFFLVVLSYRNIILEYYTDFKINKVEDLYLLRKYTKYSSIVIFSLVIILVIFGVCSLNRTPLDIIYIKDSQVKINRLSLKKLDHMDGWNTCKDYVEKKFNFGGVKVYANKVTINNEVIYFPLKNQMKINLYPGKYKIDEQLSLY